MARGNLKPVGYSRDNSRLYFRLIINGNHVLDGFFSFKKELFYVTTRNKILNGNDWDILTRELSKLDYEYSNNVDDYYYQQWLESKVIFNHGNNY
jgi:hypothetical protein